MTDIAELNDRILSEMEEAGEENVLCLLNMTTQPTGQPSDISSLQKALSLLVTRRLVVIALERRSDGLVMLDENSSLTVIAGISAHFLFDENEHDWNCAREFEIPNVVLTDEGRSQAREIVKSRGRDWWFADNDIVGP